MSLAAPLLHRLPAPVFHSLDAALGPVRPASQAYVVAAFHRIADFPGDELSYPPAAFAELLKYWRDHYEILPLHRLLARVARRLPAAHPSLTITFDDGYADNYEVAAPALDRGDLSATFFVTTARLGAVHRFPWDADLPSTPALMNWDHVRALHAAGFGIGSHTETHVRLSQTRGSQLARELEGSRARIIAELNLPETAAVEFAYPFGGEGDCDGEARRAVQAAGYRCCLSCHGGLVAATDSPFCLRRICVSPRYHARPRDWARAITRARLRQVPLSTAAHW